MIPSPRIFAAVAAVFAIGFLGAPASAQTKLNLAPEQRAQVERAIRMMEADSPAQAVALLQQEAKKYPNMELYPYETGYAYFITKDYATALSFFEEATRKPDATPQAYQMLGNTYDMQGNGPKALAAYGTGLKRFPKAGALYMETGVLHARKKEWSEAASWYERGIQEDPAYPSNYFKAADLYLSSTEKVWGLIYGEAAINLERNTKRTRFMSERLWDCYRTSISKTSDSSYSVSFTKNNTVTPEDIKKGRMPFGLMVFEPLMAMASAPVMVAGDSLGTEQMCTIRSRFLEAYNEKKFNEKYPNPLFAYQNTLQAAGYLDAYNHWLLLAGDESAFDAWQTAHPSDWKRFAAWFSEHPLQLTPQNAFARH